jgi:2-dehydro-3-deoxygalactonokinase
MHGASVADRCDGPGIIGLGRPPADVLHEAIAPWLADGAPATITLCGMAGARGGLHQAGYAECPVSAADWTRQTVRLDIGGTPVRIAAGCATRRSAERDDVMRGEETQVFGALAVKPQLGRGRQIVVLPGTHSKWVTLEDGRITGLRTFLTGELFALLQSSSLLAAWESVEDDPNGFAAGLDRAARGGLLGNLFEVRAAQLRRGRSPSWARSFLSGLLIGAEVAELQSLSDAPSAVHLIGDPALTDHYRQALAGAKIDGVLLDGEGCALSGLRLIDADD